VLLKNPDLKSFPFPSLKMSQKIEEEENEEDGWIDFQNTLSTDSCGLDLFLTFIRRLTSVWQWNPYMRRGGSSTSSLPSRCKRRVYFRE
jgi:hypothetical protein